MRARLTARPHSIQAALSSIRLNRRYALQTFSIPRESFPELNAAWKQILGLGYDNRHTAFGSNAVTLARNVEGLPLQM